MLPSPPNAVRLTKDKLPRLLAQYQHSLTWYSSPAPAASVLASSDVISPLSRRAAAGPFTLLRNTEVVTRAWRRSKDALTVLSDPRYYTFDEWWGKSRHHFVAVLEELSKERRLRLRKGSWRW